MSSLDPLLTISQVSVAFAGFASIVTVITNPNARKADYIYRFRVMIYSSLFTIVMSLQPFALFYFLPPEEIQWRLLSASFAIFGILLLYWTIQTEESVKGKAHNFPLFRMPIGWIVIGLNIAACTNTISPGVGPYFVGLLYSLVMSGYFFARILEVNSLSNGDNPRDN